MEPSSGGGGSGVIGGQAFRDSDNDGERDDGPDRINGVPDVNVWLFSCDPSRPVAHSRTRSNGIYRFAGVPPGEYRVVAQAPAGHVFSELPRGGASPSSSAAAESTIDPDDGRTACFELGEGERTMDWSFGLHRLGDGSGVPPTTSDPPALPPAAMDGWDADFHLLRPDPTTGNLTSRPAPGPSSKPTERLSFGPAGPTPTPSPRPTKRPSPRPTPEPTSRPSSGATARLSSKPTGGQYFTRTKRPSTTSGLSFRPALRTSLEPTQGSSLRPTSDPYFTPTPRPSLMPSSGPSSTPTSEPSPRPTWESSPPLTLIPTSESAPPPWTRTTTGPASVRSSRPKPRPSLKPTSGSGPIFLTEHRPTNGTLTSATASGMTADYLPPAVSAAPSDSMPPAVVVAPSEGTFVGERGPGIDGGGGDYDRGEIVFALAFLAAATLALTGLLLACRRRRRERRNKDNEGKDDGNGVEHTEGPSTSLMEGGAVDHSNAEGGEDPEPGAERRLAPPAGKDWFENTLKRQSLATISSRLAAEADREDDAARNNWVDDEGRPPSRRDSSSTVSDAPPLVSLSYHSVTTRSLSSSEQVCSSDDQVPGTNTAENDDSTSMSISPVGDDEAPTIFWYSSARPIECSVLPEMMPEPPPRTLSTIMRGFSYSGDWPPPAAGDDHAGFHGGKMIPLRNFSPNDVMADVSTSRNSGENNRDATYGGRFKSNGPAGPPPGQPRQLISNSVASMSPASSHFAAKAEIENIRNLERELTTLNTAIRSYPKNSQTWLLIHSYMDRAREELDAILQDVEIYPHTIHIMAPPGNLGLMVDKPTDGGPVYIRSLHPMSPLSDRVWPRDKIVAIDGEDVQGLSPVEVGMLLCQTTAKDMSKITIVRDDVLVGCGGPDDANDDQEPPTAAGDAGSKGGHSTSEDTSKVDEDRSEPERVGVPRSSKNNESEQKTGQSLTDRSCATAVQEPLPNAIDSILKADAEKGSCDEDPLPSVVDLISNVKHFLQKLAEEEESSNGDDYLEATSAPSAAALDSKIVEEEVNTWHSQLCCRKSSEGGTANTTQDKIRKQVRAFKEKRLRRLESIERKGAKGTIPLDKITRGVAALPPPPHYNEKLPASPYNNERKPPLPPKKHAMNSHEKKRSKHQESIEIRSDKINEGGITAPPLPGPREKLPAPPSNKGNMPPSPRKHGSSERKASARDRLDPKIGQRAPDEIEEIGNEDGGAPPPSPSSPKNREASARDRVDRKPHRWPSDKIKRGDGGVLPPPPSPKEHVATEHDASSARDRLDRKVCRQQSQRGARADMECEVVARIKSRNLERRCSLIERDEAEGGDVPVAEIWMWSDDEKSMDFDK